MPRYRLLDSDDSFLDSSQNISSPTALLSTPEIKQNVEAAASVGAGCQALPSDLQKKVHNPLQDSPQIFHSEKALPSDAFNTPENKPINIIIESTHMPSTDEFCQSPLATLPPLENYHQIPKRDRDVAVVYNSPHLKKMWIFCQI
ncbi:hypothetical protein RND81_04G048700 [Saponaria officinalis]|uniref:Uncharacterized protein n=1 Tax=Saponaria officinalis TaxID=3572 RepID=A0AAW1LIL6_SAPOF